MDFMTLVFVEHSSGTMSTGVPLLVIFTPPVTWNTTVSTYVPFLFKQRFKCPWKPQ